MKMNIIDYEIRERIYRRAINTYGEQSQKLMAIEEMSELIKEICKDFRGKTDIDHIAEEIADVTIMLEQLRQIYGCDEVFYKYIDEKVKRLAQRINDASAEVNHG